MKVLIKSMHSQLYVAPRGGWTGDLTQADDFIVTTIAYNLARQMTPGRFQILLHVIETNELIPFMEGVGRAVA